MDHYEEIMAGTFQRDLFHGTFGEKTDGMSRQYRIPVCILFQRNLPDGSQRSSDPGLLMDRMIQAVLYYDTDRELNAIDSRVLSFISDNYKKGLQLSGRRKERGREAVSPPASGDRLCLWDDRQLCKAPVSGYERDYLRQRHQ